MKNKMVYTLDDKVVRCHDEKCTDKDNCIRWICREDEYASHAGSMFEFDFVSSINGDNKCLNIMEVKNNE